MNNCKVIVFAGSKGGAGVTTISILMARVLAYLGKKTAYLQLSDFPDAHAWNPRVKKKGYHELKKLADRGTITSGAFEHLTPVFLDVAYYIPHIHELVRWVLLPHQNLQLHL